MRGLLLALALAAPAFAQTKIWDGVYTAEQAERGKAVFLKSCSNCHIADLGGSVRGPSLKGERFLAAWRNTTVNDLFRKIRDSMPATYPETVGEPAKIDVITYLLDQNGFPPGSSELKVEGDLESIAIVEKNARGVPNFALVRVVGCLKPGPAKTWTLVKASEPAVTTRDNPSNALGTQTFLLISAAQFHPESHAGDRMEAHGLLYRDARESRLNLTALAPSPGACDP